MALNLSRIPQGAQWSCFLLERDSVAVCFETFVPRNGSRIAGFILLERGGEVEGGGDRRIFSRAASRLDFLRGWRQGLM